MLIVIPTPRVPKPIIAGESHFFETAYMVCVSMAYVNGFYFRKLDAAVYQSKGNSRPAVNEKFLFILAEKKRLVEIDHAKSIPAPDDSDFHSLLLLALMSHEEPTKVREAIV